MKNKLKFTLWLLLFLFSFRLPAVENQRNCLILLDHYNLECVGRPHKWFLMAPLQAAIAEQTTPILLHHNLWHSFIERRIYFAQKLKEKDSPHYKAYNLYHAINEKMEYWSHSYTSQSPDICQNKRLVLQKINQEFYLDQEPVADEYFYSLMYYETEFDPRNWDIYKNQTGFYLLIPKKYQEHSQESLGFKIDSLEKIPYPEDPAYLYLDSRHPVSFTKALSDIFVTYDDVSDEDIPYAWNIALSGHGGLVYEEINHNQTVSWSGKPSIADLDLQEFQDTLEFFQSKLNTRLLYYISCYGGGNHIPLVFNNDEKKTFNFAMICATLTDCAAYAKWTNIFPSEKTPFLTSTDLVYDVAKKCWQIPLNTGYQYKKFFEEIEKIDFSVDSIESLEKIIAYITQPILANIPLLYLPETPTFFPLLSSDVFKIDDRLSKDKENDSLFIQGVKTVLIESRLIEPTLILDQVDPLRIISIQPDHAVHYIKKLKASRYMDIPSVFWQAHYQWYHKTFVIEECSFPYSEESEIFRDLSSQGNEIVLKNVIITQERCYVIRLFFTFNGKAMMVVAHKPNENEFPEKAVIQEIITLTPEAKNTYEKYYSSFFN